jgi:hypothetical protein
MLKKIFIVLGVLFGLITISAITIAMLYEEQVKKIVIGEINKKLIAPVQVRDIQFSLIKNFPNASLSFYDVKAQSVYDGNDYKSCPANLITAKEISLQFNLMDIFNGNYTINKIVLNGVNLSLFVDKKGDDNYHCWRSDSSSNKSAVTFKMNKIAVDDFEAKYADQKQFLEFDFLFKEAHVKGEIFDNDFTMLLQSNLKIKELKVQKNQFLRNKDVVLNINLLKQNKIYSFKDANVAIEKLKLNLTGTFDHENIDLKAKGAELDIQSFLSLLPEKVSEKFIDYSSKGIFALDLTLKGKQSLPQIKANFNIQHAQFGKSSSKVTFNNVNLKGYYSNGNTQNLKSSGIYINNFSANLNQSPIEGSFSVIDFTNPFIDGKIKANFELSEVKEIMQLDTFEILKGSANIALRISCLLEQLKKQDISQTKPGQLSGSMQLKAAQFQFKNDKAGYENIDADLYADDNYILVKQLSFLHGKSQLELRGELSNYQALIGNNSEKSLLRAYLVADNFELEDWLPKSQIKSVADKENNETYLKNIDLKLNTNITRFKFDKFIATNVKSNIYFRENQFRFDSLFFNSMDGDANANGAIELKENGSFDLLCDAKLSKINIIKLFEQLNNFGQTTLTDKNIAGKLSAEIKYKSSWSNINQIIPESIIAEATVLISNGELNNFTPMNKLSKFVSVSELSHIKFNELANTISINNKKIYIPQFQIKSTAMNLYCSGTHDFDNNIDYHFKVTLSELLSKKRKREVPKNNEFDEIEDDEQGKSTLFISMTGNIDHPKIKFDKKELKQFVKDEIKNEKQTVKQLLKDEFGLFKKDKSLKEKEEHKLIKPKEFEVEWEEEQKSTPRVQKPGEEKKSNQIFGGENNKAEKEQDKSKRKNKKKKEENSDDFL